MVPVAEYKCSVFSVAWLSSKCCPRSVVSLALNNAKKCCAVGGMSSDMLLLPTTAPHPLVAPTARTNASPEVPPCICPTLVPPPFPLPLSPGHVVHLYFRVVSVYRMECHALSPVDPPCLSLMCCYLQVDGKVRTDVNFPAGFMGESEVPLGKNGPVCCARTVPRTTL